MYHLRVDQVERGPMAVGEQILVHAADDWTCESRGEEYAAGQWLLLFLDPQADSTWSPTFGFQSERIPDDGRLDEPHIGIDPTWQSKQFLAGLGKLVAFVERPAAQEVEGWLELLADPNSEVQRFALLRIEDYSMIQYGLSFQGSRDLSDLTGDERTSLWQAADPFTESPHPGLRSAARGSLTELWRGMDDGERAAMNAARDASSGRMLERVPDAESSAEARHCAGMAARLGDAAALLPILELLQAGEHRRHDDLFEALVVLHGQHSLRVTSVLDALAAHEVHAECERPLCNLAVQILKQGPLPSLDVKGQPRDHWARLFREWWERHRGEIR